MSGQRIVVDEIDGKDEENSRICKTLEYAVEIMKQRDSILLNPCVYPGINVSSESLLEFSIEGICVGTDLLFITYYGFVNCHFRKVRLNEIKIKVDNSFIEFTDVDFQANNQFVVSALENNDITEIVFNNCTFGINYQLIFRDTSLNVTFKNCNFRVKRTLSLIKAKKCKLNINITLCNLLEVVLIENTSSDVEIRQSNCIIDKLFIGKDCNCISQIDSMMQEQRTISSSQIEQKRVSTKSVKSKVMTVDTNNCNRCFVNVGIEFIHLQGRKSVEVILPNKRDVYIGHCIEILNESTYFRVEGKDYHHKVVKIRLMTSGWIVYSTNTIAT